ncbi:gluconokinase [Curtobacterium ammoniigenes]|uniref:gluconokinase n=1 Tax=Curtobacterium ammoniigenes TaxID=395387 RepID=UPI000AD8B60A|nr:gluconokinase [Curtobacterium ammoniigenes]
MADVAPQSVPTAVLVMGVSGSGKSTIGEALAEHWNAAGVRTEFVDADDLHPAANKEKMHRGIPLTDDDRWPWLDRCAERMAEVLATGSRCVLANSGLKRAYRDRLRRTVPELFTVFLEGSRELLDERVHTRHHEFMPATLLDSQLETLEPLADDESGVVVEIGRTPDAIVADVDAALVGA